MEDLTQLEMRYGDHICKLIKQIYYKDAAWVESYRLVAQKFSEFKRKMRIVYPEIKEMADVLEKVQYYSSKEVIDALNPTSTHTNGHQIPNLRIDQKNI